MLPFLGYVWAVELTVALQNSVAIWDNRSNYHTATFDYGREKRVGDRVVSLVRLYRLCVPVAC